MAFMPYNNDWLLSFANTSINVFFNSPAIFPFIYPLINFDAVN